jgi:small subunit ribosomal protein S6
MNIYETVLIVKPQLSDTEIGGILDKTKKVLTTEGAEILNEDKWGRRKLSYPIKQSREGFYIYLKYQAGPSALSRFEQQLRVMEPVLRSLTLRHEERKARVKKVKKAKV